MSDNSRFILSKIINAVLIALGSIAGAIFGGN